MVLQTCAPMPSETTYPVRGSQLFPTAVEFLKWVRVANSKERVAWVTTNTIDVQDNEGGPKREPGKAMPSPGALWTRVWKVFYYRF